MPSAELETCSPRRTSSRKDHPFFLNAIF